MSDTCTAAFPQLLKLNRWEFSRNIPSLTRLLIAYLRKGIIQTLNHQSKSLDDIVVVFHVLIQNENYKQYTFDLLRAIVLYVPPEVRCFKEVLNVVKFEAMSSHPTRLSNEILSHFFTLFVAKFGTKAFYDVFDCKSNDLAINFLLYKWIPSLLSTPPTRLEAKSHIFGLTRLLFGDRALGFDIQSEIICCAIKIILSPNFYRDALSSDGDDDYVEIRYDATYPVLHFAAMPSSDPSPDVSDATTKLAQMLRELSDERHHLFTFLMEKCHLETTSFSKLQSLLVEAGVWNP